MYLRTLIKKGLAFLYPMLENVFGEIQLANSPFLSICNLNTIPPTINFSHFVHKTGT